jgi:hypothetical protein
LNASDEEESDSEVAARAIAFYLPQFHPIPENDQWWGSGFTEWTNTARARALFPGHRQPHVPADLGFYDLRLPEARAAQADLAQAHGIEAFCYWHYWFGGRQLLERPFSEVLSSGVPKIKFCLAWANETWSGVWHGAQDRILMEQTYPGPEDDRAHFESLLPAFADERYLRIDGRPLFYVLRPQLLPDARAFVDSWQEMAVRAGLGTLYMVAEVSDLMGGGPSYTSIKEHGFDAGCYQRLPVIVGRTTKWRTRVERRLMYWPTRYRYSSIPIEGPPDLEGATLHPCLYPNWDNTPRSGRGGVVLTSSEPGRFRIHVREAVRRSASRPFEERLLFIKSWNEWAEGNHLEPDLQYGHGYLDALSSELRRGVTRWQGPLASGTLSP